MGDIVGSRFEFDNHRSVDFDLFTSECFVTDDSIMTLAVSKAILETDKLLQVLENTEKAYANYLRVLSENTVKCMQKIGRKYPNCGYGGSFGQWIFSVNPQPYNSYGNGAAMRISPVCEVGKNIEKVKALTRAVTEISHNHDEGIKGAEATAKVAFLAGNGYDKQQIKEYIEERYYTLDFTLDEIRDTYQFNETCQETVP